MDVIAASREYGCTDYKQPVMDMWGFRGDSKPKNVKIIFGGPASCCLVSRKNSDGRDRSRRTYDTANGPNLNHCCTGHLGIRELPTVYLTAALLFPDIIEHYGNKEGRE